MKLMECINPRRDRWIIRFDKHSETIDDGTGNSIEAVGYRKEVLNYQPTLDEIKAIVADAISEYDSSSEVNGFTLNGTTMWLDKQTRTSLMQTVSAGEEDGETTLWSGTIPPVSFSMKNSVLKQILTELETYAKATYDVTQTHKATVCALNTAEEVLSFDIRADYPNLLTFDL